IEFPQRDQTHDADQSVEREFVSGKNDQQRNRPEHDRAGKAENEDGTPRRWFGFAAFERCGHAVCIIPVQEELSTSESACAARLLDGSRRTVKLRTLACS